MPPKRKSPAVARGKAVLQVKSSADPLKEDTTEVPQNDGIEATEDSRSIATSALTGRDSGNDGTATKECVEAVDLNKSCDEEMVEECIEGDGGEEEEIQLIGEKMESADNDSDVDRNCNMDLGEYSVVDELGGDEGKECELKKTAEKKVNSDEKGTLVKEKNAKSACDMPKPLVRENDSLTPALSEQKLEMGANNGEDMEISSATVAEKITPNSTEMEKKENDKEEVKGDEKSKLSSEELYIQNKVAVMRKRAFGFRQSAPIYDKSNFDDGMFEYKIKMDGFRYYDLKHRAFMEVIGLVDSIRCSVTHQSLNSTNNKSKSSYTGWVELLLHKEYASRVMERLIFCPLKNDHLTFEIQRRKQDPDASIVSDADKSDTVKPTYPIVADTMVFKARNEFVERHITSLKLHGTDRGTTKRRSIILNNLPPSVDKDLLKLIYPRALNIAVAMVSADTSSAVVELASAQHADNYMIAFTGLKINDRDIQISTLYKAQDSIVSAWEKRNSQPQVTKVQTTPSEKSNITPKQSDALLIESSGKDENKKQQEQSQKQKEKQLPAPSQQGNSEVPTSQKSKESLEQTVSRNKTVEIVQEKKEPAKDKGAMHGDKDKKKDSEKEKAEKQKRESEKLLKEKRDKEKREKELQEKEKNKNKMGTFDPKNKKESTQKGSSVPTLTNYTIPKKTVNDRPQKMSAMQRKRERPMKFQNSQSLEMGSNFRFQSKNQRLKSKQNQSPLKFYGNDREPFAKRRRMDDTNASFVMGRGFGEPLQSDNYQRLLSEQAAMQTSFISSLGGANQRSFAANLDMPSSMYEDRNRGIDRNLMQDIGSLGIQESRNIEMQQGLERRHQDLSGRIQEDFGRSRQQDFHRNSQLEFGHGMYQGDDRGLLQDFDRNLPQNPPRSSQQSLERNLERNFETEQQGMRDFDDRIWQTSVRSSSQAFDNVGQQGFEMRAQHTQSMNQPNVEQRMILKANSQWQDSDEGMKGFKPDYRQHGLQDDFNQNVSRNTESRAPKEVGMRRLPGVPKDGGMRGLLDIPDVRMRGSSGSFKDEGMRGLLDTPTLGMRGLLDAPEVGMRGTFGGPKDVGMRGLLDTPDVGMRGVSGAQQDLGMRGLAGVRKDVGMRGQPSASQELGMRGVADTRKEVGIRGQPGAPKGVGIRGLPVNQKNVGLRGLPGTSGGSRQQAKAEEDEIELAKQNLQMQVLAQAEGLKKKLALLESLHLPGSEMSTISQPTDDLRNTMKQLQQTVHAVTGNMRPHTLPGDRKEMTSQKPMPLFPNSRVESRELEVQRSDFERQRGPMSRNMQAKFSGPAEKDIERQSMGRRDWMEDRPKKIGSQDISLEQSHLQQDMQLFRQSGPDTDFRNRGEFEMGRQLHMNKNLQAHPSENEREMMSRGRRDMHESRSDEYNRPRQEMGYDQSYAPDRGGFEQPQMQKFDYSHSSKQEKYGTLPERAPDSRMGYGASNIQRKPAGLVTANRNNYQANEASTGELPENYERMKSYKEMPSAQEARKHEMTAGRAYMDFGAAQNSGNYGRGPRQQEEMSMRKLDRLY